MNYRLIEELRNANNFTQIELSGLVGRTREWYTRMIKAKKITVADLENLAKVFNVSPEIFFNENKKHAPKTMEEPLENYSNAQNRIDYRTKYETTLESLLKSTNSLIDMAEKNENLKTKLKECENRLVQSEKEVEKLNNQLIKFTQGK